jgi:hypothetical protein
MTATETTKSNAPTTAQDLLDVMAENIQRLRDGESTPAVANAIVNSSAAMLRIVKLQMEYAKLTNRTPSIPLLLTGDNDK